MAKHLDTRQVMRWLPLYELCLYSGSCNRAAAFSGASQATLNRAHRAIVALLEEAETKKLSNLLETLRLAAQKLRTTESLCRIEGDPFLPIAANGSGVQIELWQRRKADLTASLQLLGDRICDVFVGSLYDLELERRSKLLHFQGQPLVVEPLIRTPLWRIGPAGCQGSDLGQKPTLSLKQNLQHARLISKLKDSGYQIQPSSRRPRLDAPASNSEVISQLQLTHVPIPAEFSLLDPEPIDHDVIGIAYNASYAEEQPFFKEMMSQLTRQLRQGLQTEMEMAGKTVLAKMD